MAVKIQSWWRIPQVALRVETAQAPSRLTYFIRDQKEKKKKKKGEPSFFRPKIGKRATFSPLLNVINVQAKEDDD